MLECLAVTWLTVKAGTDPVKKLEKMTVYGKSEYCIEYKKTAVVRYPLEF